jgi:hypothetical protein
MEKMRAPEPGRSSGEGRGDQITYNESAEYKKSVQLLFNLIDSAANGKKEISAGSTTLTLIDENPRGWQSSSENSWRVYEDGTFEEINSQQATSPQTVRQEKIEDLIIQYKGTL